MKKLKNYIGLLIIPFVMLVSCNDEHQIPGESPDQTVIYSIKIVNAGASGDSIVEGFVNENSKKITFPRLSHTTNLRGIKFDARVSDRARLDSVSYTFEHNKDRFIIVRNGVRQREYIIKIRNQPVFGADFDLGTLFDFSSNPLPNAIHPDFTGDNTRSSHFDGAHVLVVSRTKGTNKDEANPKLYTLADIINNDISNPIMLKLTNTSAPSNNVTGGAHAVTSGRLAQGHIYICNLTTSISATSPLKIYHWATPTAEPTLIYSFTGMLGARFGESLSVDLDTSGNGYIFVGNQLSLQVTNILRLKVTNFTTVSDPVLFAPPAANPSFYISYNKVDGVDGEYIFTGFQAPITLVDASGTVIYKMANGSVPLLGSDARIINFNKERYLIMTTARRAATDNEPTIWVYDITAGASTKEALQLFEAGSRIAVFSYVMSGATNNGNPGTNTGWAVIDNVLYLYGASTRAGFALHSFPIKD